METVNQELTEKFIKTSQKLHQVFGIPKYHYGETEVVNAWSTVTITCPIHGNFEQTPAEHIIDIKEPCPFCRALSDEERMKYYHELYPQKS